MGKSIIRSSAVVNKESRSGGLISITPFPTHYTRLIRVCLQVFLGQLLSVEAENGFQSPVKREGVKVFRGRGIGNRSKKQRMGRKFVCEFV